MEDGQVWEGSWGLVDCKAGIFILFTLVSQHLQQCLAYNMCSVIFVDYVIPVEHQ